MPCMNVAIATPVHIAIVDDEADIRQLLGAYLVPQGFRVTPLATGRELLALMHRDAPQLVLLDLGLPGEDGFAIARQLREHWHCGLLIVTGRGDPIDKVVGLEVGADDYVTKPFDLRELLARIKAVLRRLQPAQAGASNKAQPETTLPQERYRFMDWQLDAGARRLEHERAGPVELTGGEFDLLTVFLRHAGRVLSREFLLEQTRGREAGPYDRTIDVQVGRLRRKLQACMPEQAAELIRAVRGAGYQLVALVERQ